MDREKTKSPVSREYVGADFGESKYPSTDSRLSSGSIHAPPNIIQQNRSSPVAASHHPHFQRVMSQEWKAVGSPRRASYAAPISGNYFEELISPSLSPSISSADINRQNSLTPPPPGFTNNSAGLSRSISPLAGGYANDDPLVETVEPPIFQFYGGRSHGTRSFSFSLGGTNDLLMISPEGERNMSTSPFQPSLAPPSIGSPYRRTSSTGGGLVPENFSRGPRKSLSPLEEDPIFGPSSDGHAPLSMQEMLHRPYSNHLWSGSSPLSGDMQRRASTQAIFYGSVAPAPESQEIANKYFARDNSLLDRRHSSVPAAQGVDRLTYRMGQMELMKQVKQQSGHLPSDFGMQYGNLIESSMIVQPSSGRSSSHARSPSPKAIEHQGNSPNGTATPPPATPSTSGTAASVSSASLIGSRYGPLFVVEFKGGRSDVFYQTDMNLHLRENDLVIVEADRGKDLGKVIKANITSFDAFQGMIGASDLISAANEPKAIIRPAQAAEVSMLMDKARDESKALSICVAKSKQKGLPMEVIDAEYQWDRKKLTFYFVSDERIDFRELVKDLFRIYKTRIWMCSVERSGNGVRIFAK